jgi:hypothetical protein
MKRFIKEMVRNVHEFDNGVERKEVAL